MIAPTPNKKEPPVGGRYKNDAAFGAGSQTGECFKLTGEQRC